MTTSKPKKKRNKTRPQSRCGGGGGGGGGGNRNKNKNKNDVITTKTTNQPADIGTSTSSHKNSVHNPVKKKGGDGGSVSPLIEGEGRLQKRFSTTSFHIFLLLWLLFLSFFFVMDCSREAPGGGWGVKQLANGLADAGLVSDDQLDVVVVVKKNR